MPWRRMTRRLNRYRNATFWAALMLAGTFLVLLPRLAQENEKYGVLHWCRDRRIDLQNSRRLNGRGDRPNCQYPTALCTYSVGAYIDNARANQPAANRCRSPTAAVLQILRPVYLRLRKLCITTRKTRQQQQQHQTKGAVSIEPEYVGVQPTFSPAPPPLACHDSCTCASTSSTEQPKPRRSRAARLRQLLHQNRARRARERKCQG